MDAGLMPVLSVEEFIALKLERAAKFEEHANKNNNHDPDSGPRRVSLLYLDEAIALDNVLQTKGHAAAVQYAWARMHKFLK